MKLRDEALFKDPPPKEDCPICFLPMPIKMICCISLPPATISSVPIYNFAIDNKELATKSAGEQYECCGNTICRGCIYSNADAGNDHKCPFCNSVRGGKTEEEKNEELMKRVEANDADSICVLASYYHHGQLGLHQNAEKAKELWTQAAKLGSCQAHYHLGISYYAGGDTKKEKFHYEAGAMAGDEMARYNLGSIES